MTRPALAIGAAVLVAGAFTAGLATRAHTAHPDPVRLDRGVPIGVLHTPDGAVAAADNYLAAEDGALLSPDQLRQVIATDWTPRERQVELSQPLPTATLKTTPQQLGDTRLTAVVAANKLESFSSNRAQVGVWHELTTWSSTRPPAQHWMLDTVTLVWQDGRWLTTSRVTAPDADTPVPAWTNGGPSDRTSQAWDEQLAGMTAPYYGALP